MFTFIFSLLLLFSTTATTAQPYNATDHLHLACGSSSTADGWQGDEGSKFTPPNITTTSFSSTPSSQGPIGSKKPYTTARIFNAYSFTYTFPVSKGPKFLRLHFYPATYSDLQPNQSFFSVSANGYTLLTNFSAFLASSFIENFRSDAIDGGAQVSNFVKEFIIHVKDAQILNVTFTPEPNSYAFINGIEIVSMPENLYFNDENLNYVGQTTGPRIGDDMVFETMYRLNVGGLYISGDADTGMNRSWELDDGYILGAAYGLTPNTTTPITYTMETPNYTAPEQVYATQRSMGNLSEHYNLTWTLPVDSGFYYMIRLHFCNIIPQYNRSGQMVFTIFMNNQTAEKKADPLYWTQGKGHPVFKDYVSFVSDPDNPESKQDLWLTMHPNFGASAEYLDAYLNGLEAFKLSEDGSLASPNPELSPTPPLPTPSSPIKGNKNRTPSYAAIIGGVGGGLVFLSLLVLIVFRQRRRVKNYSADDKSSYGPVFIESKSTHSCHSSLPSDRCRHFSLTEVKAATREFNDECIIGRGGFGKVYKGYIDNITTTVAIKRLNTSSNQGFREFHTEIAWLSKLRHVHLVSLIGYCDDDEEMVLVYDYMAHGTLREHLYKSNNPPLSWKRRLHICIGAARGLHYLHTSAKRRIIHRDVKSTNILLDENWVAKVSDFGLSKLGPNDPSQTHVSTVVKGSMGYVDPEYFQKQQLTDKSDVYSFGVVLLEVLCARPAIIPGLAKEQVSLAEWGKYCYRNGILDQIIDPKLRDGIATESLTKFGEVANSCLKEKGCDRLSMEEVVYKLELALEVQESAEKTGGGAVSENQELPFLRQGEVTTTDDDVFSGSSAIRNGTSSVSRSYEGFKSETVFSEMGKPAGR
ncbi:receptor-like protein kinase FERONIA [Cynara cardunculus var. scolymus]|uniref:receptor-like protein kinase FERONIA n=1 Tax=Cynara cardunculus var. scolymus TaxID=59895 RepID=UPI000D626116|nr:receptor-like protein kinase FERONIA [Cynara cardunculus var. scolymus]